MGKSETETKQCLRSMAYEITRGIITKAEENNLSTEQQLKLIEETEGQLKQEKHSLTRK